MKRVENLCSYKFNLIKRKQHQMVCILILEFRRFTILANTYQNKKEKSRWTFHDNNTHTCMRMIGQERQSYEQLVPDGGARQECLTVSHFAFRLTTKSKFTLRLQNLIKKKKD